MSEYMSSKKHDNSAQIPLGSMQMCFILGPMAAIGKDDHDITHSTQGYRGMQLHMHSHRKESERFITIALLQYLQMFSASLK